MAENTKRTKELTSTQEGIIAGLVLLFFGLLYWYLNPWQSEQQSMPNLAEQTATGNIQRHSLADTSPTQATSTTETGTDTSQTQTAATTTSPQPQTTTQATPPTSATVPTAASATSNATMSGTAAEPVLTAAALAETTPAKPTPATTTEATAAASAGSPTSSPVDTPNTAPASSTPSAAASPSTQTTAETTAAPETPASEAKAAEASTNTTQTTDIVAAKPADTTTTTTTAKPNMVNKLELAPGSPEAKLQSYLEKKTLETPVSMDGINFEAKTTKLTKESDAAVLLLAALLAQYPEANFLITSYTTDTGNENQNSDELSLIRAQTLGESLVKAGVNAKRITIMGMGKRPSPDPTSVASKKSQHIEISVIQ